MEVEIKIVKVVNKINSKIIIWINNKIGKIIKIKIKNKNKNKNLKKHNNNYKNKNNYKMMDGL